MTTMIAEVFEALKEAGVSDEKAKAAAEVLAEYRELKAIIPNLATKADLEAVRTDVESIKAEIPHLATKADIETVRTEVHRIGMIIIMWNVGTIIATAGIVFAILRFLGNAG
jgi:hypothetical protein